MKRKTKDKTQREQARKERRERLKARLYKIYSVAKHALFPDDVTCDLCSEELVADTRYHLCGECMAKLPRTGDHICLVCGVPILDEADYCIRCQNQKGEYLMNRSPLVYDGNAKQLIYAMKFGRKKYIAKTLDAMMSDEFIKRKMSADIAVFVPMTRDEEKKRGYNQSELLARDVADRLGLPLLPALVKTKDTSAQKQLSMKEREQNLTDAFACIYKEVKDRKILLVDDVFTTGATANACTHTLLKAGAKEVCVLTAAVTKKKIPVESEDGTQAI